MVSLSIHLSVDAKPASMSWLLQIILQWTLGTYKCEPHWPPKPGDLELSPGSNCKHQGTRQVLKFLSRRYCPAGTRQREQRRLLPAAKPLESVKLEVGPSGWWCFEINKPLSQKVWALFSCCPRARPQEGDQIHAALQKRFLPSWAWWVLQFHWLSKVDIWGLSSQMQVFTGGVPSLGFTPFTSQAAAGDGSFLPIVGHHAESWVDGETMSQPFLSTLMWAVGQMCRSCSEEETIPGLATDFMCPREEVSVVGSSLNETLDLYLCSHTHAQTYTYTES